MSAQSLLFIFRLVRKLAIKSDVLLENFKPGSACASAVYLIIEMLIIIIALEKWNLGPSSLHPHNPDLIYTRVSGYGQTGPWASRPGYASVCEAESGFRYINGFPDPETGLLSGPPVRPNISLGDSVAGLHAAFGTVSVSMIEITLPSDVMYVGFIAGACVIGSPEKT
jgi:crotonobetainyl-CoA:carnitine CoA-transferase CaiB-like acyl-CoA transferase